MDTEKPMRVIGSPSCTPDSPLQAPSASRRGPDEAKRQQTRAGINMEFATSLYKERVSSGRRVLHEHQLCATPWNLDCVLDIMAVSGVDSGWCDQCQYGQDVIGEPVKKPTRWMPNSPEILSMLKLKCVNKDGRCPRPGGVQTSPMHRRRCTHGSHLLDESVQSNHPRMQSATA